MTISADKAYPYMSTYGYRMVRIGKRSVRAHRLFVEGILGHPLPRKAVIHHINGDKADNRPCNLVVCQDQAYHSILHRRQRALEECGDPSRVQCYYCKGWDDPGNMARAASHNAPTGLGVFRHRECAFAHFQKKRLASAAPPPVLVVCPTCDAEVGQPCKLPNGFHRTRHDAQRRLS